MSILKDFKPEIKLFVLVALIAVVVSVAGILLLRTMAPVSSQPGLQTNFSIGEEVAVKGRVIENVTYCMVDLDCYLRVDMEGKELVVPYGYGRNTQGRYCTEGSVQSAFDAKKNDEIEVFGKVVSETEISPCDSSAYYIKLLSDPASIDTSDWQTYRNEEFGFEVRYPTDWFNVSPGQSETMFAFSDSKEAEDVAILIGVMKVGDLLFGSIDVSFFFEELRVKKHGEILKKDVFDKKSIVFTKIADEVVDGMPAIRFIGDYRNIPGESLPTGEQVLVVNEDALFFFSMIGSSTEMIENNKGTFEQILSTFRFAK